MKRFFSYSIFGTIIVFIFGGFVLLNRLMEYRSDLADLKDEGFPIAIADLELTPEVGQADATKQFSRLIGPLGSFEAEMYEVYNTADPDFGDKAVNLFDELNTAYPTVYPLITEIADAGFVGFENKEAGLRETLDFELERIKNVRSCARVLHFRAEILLAQGKPDQALKSIIEIFKLCRTFDQHPSLICHLVRCACRGIAIREAYEILSQHDIEQESRIQLNQLLESYEASDGYRWTLVSERAVGSSLLSEMGAVPLAFSGKAYLDLIANELEQCDKEAFEKDLSFENEISLLDGGHAQMVLPALSTTRHANSRLKSQVRGLRIVSALTANLDSAEQEITKEYLIGLGVPESMTVDTMNGELMKVKRTDEQWLVYSVGLNLADDGGNANEVKDFVVGPVVVGPE